eukprot:scaffold30_cov166-Ochromonas_danica.AAC.1
MQSQQVHYHPTSSSTGMTPLAAEEEGSAPLQDEAARYPSPPPPAPPAPPSLWDCPKCEAESEASQPRLLEVVANEERYLLLLSSLTERYLANKALEFCVERLKLSLDEAVAKCQDPVRSHLLKEAEAMRQEAAQEEEEEEEGKASLRPAGQRRLFREGGKDFLRLSITGRGDFVLSLDGEVEVEEVARRFCREHAEAFALVEPADLSACTLAVRDHINLVVQEEEEEEELKKVADSSSTLQPDQ